jgi:hypothetical protein
MMDYKKVFIEDDGKVRITCPECNHAQIVPAKKLQNKHRLKVKCRCTSVFGIQVEFRKKFRKESNLDGFFHKIYLGDLQGETLNESETTHIKAVNCRILDISKEGLGLGLLGEHRIETGDTLKVTFTLDNSADSKIEKKVVVRWVQNNRAGCEFLYTEKEDKMISFYLL